MTSITEVKGIGPSTAVLLAAHGINTVHDLASATIAQLSGIPGFSEVRAGQVKRSAQALLKQSESAANVTATATGKSAPLSKPGKKASAPEKEKAKKDKKKKKASQDKKEKEQAKKKDTKKAKSKEKSSKKNKKKK